MKSAVLKILGFLFLCTACSQKPTTANAKNQNFEYRTELYQCTTKSNSASVFSRSNSKNLIKKSNFNVGLTFKDYYVRYTVQNKTKAPLKLYLGFEAIVNDSLGLSKISTNTIGITKWIGETLPFENREVQNKNPVFVLHLHPSEQAIYYLQSIGNGQPMNLTATIFDEVSFTEWNANRAFFLGFIYGFMVIILTLNLSSYIIIKDKIYLYFMLQMLFSTFSMAYFDGFLYQYVAPNNGYWANELVAIVMCFNFIFYCYFTTEYYNIKTNLPVVAKVIWCTIYSYVALLFISFVHPVGFNVFVYLCTIGITVLTAVALFTIFTLKLKKTAYILGLLATVGLIVFATLFQLHIYGWVADFFGAHYGIHFGILVLSFFLAIGIQDKFRLIREENTEIQTKLAATAMQHSRNLITKIEAERQRLAMDLHDSFGQNLLVIRNSILLSKKRNKNFEQIDTMLDSLLQITADTLEDARSMSYDLRPPLLNTVGLTASINALLEKIAQSSTIKIEFLMNMNIDNLIASDLEINIYRIFQELFSNTFKHAQATSISINVNVNATHLSINYFDDGIGFNQSEVKVGQGLLSLKDRVALLSGNLHIESSADFGSKFEINIILN